MYKAKKNRVAFAALFVVALTARADAALHQDLEETGGRLSATAIAIPTEALKSADARCELDFSFCPAAFEERFDALATPKAPMPLPAIPVLPVARGQALAAPTAFATPVVPPRPAVQRRLVVAPAVLTVPEPAKPSVVAPRSIEPRLELVTTGASTLAPMAHSMFCAQYPRDCQLGTSLTEESHAFEWTEARWEELRGVNLSVNRSIRPQRNLEGLAGERWVIKPQSGDCNDYAVTKRHELLARGWPPSMLLLAEVVVSSGEHHLILVVKTAKGHFVLDNLRPDLRVWSSVPYRWIRIQSEQNPKHWLTVSRAA